jgi:hypothetical protein
LSAFGVLASGDGDDFGRAIGSKRLRGFAFHADSVCEGRKG